MMMMMISRSIVSSELSVIFRKEARADPAGGAREVTLHCKQIVAAVYELIMSALIVYCKFYTTTTSLLLLLLLLLRLLQSNKQ